MWLLIAAWVASLLVFSAFFMKTMIPLRLRQVRGLVHAVRSASDEEALQALVPYMKTESHAGGEVLFRRGDAADKLYMIQRGRVLFPEIGKNVAAGSVFGEVGLLAAPGTRSLTAVCQDDCQLSTITKRKALELYYQNPTFGMYLLRLLSGYALDHAVAGGRISPGARGPGSTPSGASTSSRSSDVEDS